MSNGSFYFGKNGFLFKKNTGVGNRRNPKLGLICNQPQDVNNTYVAGSGVGGTSVATRRAKKYHATVCNGLTGKCKQDFYFMGLPLGGIPPTPKPIPSPKPTPTPTPNPNPYVCPSITLSDIATYNEDPEGPVWTLNKDTTILECQTLTIDKTTQLYINNGLTLKNFGKIINNTGSSIFIIDPNTMFINEKSGEIINNTSSTFECSFTGMIINYGKITNNDNNFIVIGRDNSLLNNFGNIINDSTSTIISRNSGTVNNKFGGQITNDGSIQFLFFNGNPGTLNNDGTITNQNGGSIQSTGTGSQITNNSTGIITNDGTSLIISINSGIIQNDGTITNQNGGNIKSSDNDSQITNTGQITNDGTSQITAEVSGTIQNNGIITTEYLITSRESGLITNNYQITIGVGGTLQCGDMDGNIINDISGTITNNNNLVVNTGMFTNSGYITNNGSLIVDNNGTFDNSGTIDNNYSTITVISTFTNNISGTIYTHGDSAVINATGTFTNNGNIYEGQLGCGGPGTINGTIINGTNGFDCP